ncbi:hypothetical protein CBR_g49542 [Chara braunii]|uniref:Myb/SANT-like DNA-binding domain-containing protein n=1 Tax=Chara braunii TaxID=69332 RepID=A0A388M5C7_CHABU|nr:hypothetical protein CBR_g49542 [Chara braunii]|eukprot:GBG89689.1 hypothetical protein CBR_g49542 [Chara braunii]
MCSTARLAGTYDPILYRNLPPNEQPLPPDPEEQWVDDLSRTLSLGSGSTQDWMGGHCGQRGVVTSPHSFSALLEDDVGGGDTEIVDLNFGLSSGSGLAATHTRTFNLVPSVTIGRSSVHLSARMRVASGELNAEDSQRASDYESTDVICEDEVEDADDMEIRPLLVRGKGRGGGVRQEKAVSRGGRRSKGPPSEKAGKHPSWSVKEMLKLVQAKRDQQAHFEGMAHNYGRMHNREWKLQDLQKRLLEVGVDRTTNNIGKKWDNLFQQYKKVQRYETASGGKNFFNLTPSLRTEEGVNCRMEERVYDEIDAMSKGNKTIYPNNVADTSARGGLQMPRSPSVAGESAARGDGGDGNDDDGGSARESGFSAGSTGGNCKSKDMHQQTFEAIAEVMDKHGTTRRPTRLTG